MCDEIPWHVIDPQQSKAQWGIVGREPDLTDWERRLVLTLVLLNWLFLFYIQVGIFDAISSFKWRKICYENKVSRLKQIESGACTGGGGGEGAEGSWLPS